MNSEVKVSVCIITYNQEKYIDECLNGITCQKGNFHLEIVIRDDFSTDSTFEKITNNLSKINNNKITIKILEAKKNLGANRNLLEVLKNCTGEYVAFCEGDDYWIDEHKIQKQYDFISKANTDICFTNAYMQCPFGEKKSCFSDRDKYYRYTLSEIVRAGGGGMPTASIMAAKKILNTLPEWFSNAPVGDYFIQILGSYRTGAIYLDDKTCVYRVQALGSWSSDRSKISKSQIEKEANAYIGIFNQMRGSILSNEDADYAMANQLYILTLICIKLKYYKLAKKLIDLSWSSYRLVNNKQVILKYSKLFWVLLTVYLNRNTNK